MSFSSTRKVLQSGVWMSKTTALWNVLMPFKWQNVIVLMSPHGDGQSFFLLFFLHLFVLTIRITQALKSQHAETLYGIKRCYEQGSAKEKSKKDGNREKRRTVIKLSVTQKFCFWLFYDRRASKGKKPQRKYHNVSLVPVCFRLVCIECYNANVCANKNVC